MTPYLDRTRTGNEGLTADYDAGVLTITIPVADDNETAIQDLLTAALATTDIYYPSGPCVTNIDTAMSQAAAQPAIDDPDRATFVMLITDGKQSGCNAAGGDGGTEDIIDDLYQNHDVITFVVGFGGATDTAPVSIQSATAPRSPARTPPTPSPARRWRSTTRTTGCSRTMSTRKSPATTTSRSSRTRSRPAVAAP